MQMKSLSLLMTFIIFIITLFFIYSSFISNSIPFAFAFNNRIQNQDTFTSNTGTNTATTSSERTATVLSDVSLSPYDANTKPAADNRDLFSSSSSLIKSNRDEIIDEIALTILQNDEMAVGEGRDLAFNVAKCEGLLTKLIALEPSLSFLNIQCNTIASAIKKVGSLIVSKIIPDSITDTTVLAIKDVLNGLLALIARLADQVSGDYNMCFGDFDGSLFNEDLLNPNDDREFNQGALDTDGCSIIPLPNTLNDTFSVYAFSIPHFLVDPICPDPLGGALTMCFMMSFCADGVPVPETFAFTVNNEVLACLAGNTALSEATLGISKAVGEIAGMTGFTIGTGISVNGGFAQSLYVYDGTALKLATVRGNFFEALTIDASSILPEKLQKYFSLEGKQRSTFGVFGDLDAFRRDIPAVIKKEQKFQTLLDDFYFEIANHIEGSVSILLSDLTNGQISDFGPINLGGANVLLTTNPNGSGQVKPGFYVYFYGANIAVELVNAFFTYLSDFFGATLSAMREMLGDMDPLVVFQQAVEDATNKVTGKLADGLDPDNVPRLAIWLTGFDDRAFTSESNIEFGIRFEISPKAAFPFYDDVTNGIAKGLNAISKSANGARDIVAKYFERLGCDSAGLESIPVPDATRIRENIEGMDRVGLELVVKGTNAKVQLLFKNPFTGVFDTRVFKDAGRDAINSFVSGFCENNVYCLKNMTFDAALIRGNMRFSVISLATSFARGISSTLNRFVPKCGFVKALSSIPEFKTFFLNAIGTFVEDVIEFTKCMTDGGSQTLFCLKIGTKNVYEQVRECKPDKWIEENICSEDWGPFNDLKCVCTLVRKVVRGVCNLVEKFIGVFDDILCVKKCSITRYLDRVTCALASCIPNLSNSAVQQGNQRICTSTNKCYKGEGSCSYHTECQSGLRCDLFYTKKCIAEGQPNFCLYGYCGLNQGPCTPNPYGDEQCYQGLRCSATTNKCIADGHADFCQVKNCFNGQGRCSSNDQCIGGICFKGICRSITDDLCSSSGCQPGYRCRNRCVAPSECFRPSCAYCTDTEKCEEGVGECTNSNQCLGTLRCRDGKCRSASYPTYCSILEPCDYNIGKCSTSYECKQGLLCEDGVCKQAQLGGVCEVGMCAFAAGLRCRNGKCVDQAIDFCSKALRCKNGQGNCRSDLECDDGMKCAPALVSDPSGFSRCRAPNTVGYCHANSKCKAGEGYCESDDQCSTNKCSGGKCLALIGGYCDKNTVCSDSHCNFATNECVGPGDDGYCSFDYYCDIGQGNCKGNDGCSNGRCGPSIIPNYNTCVELGEEGYCSNQFGNKCNLGEGLCSIDDDCATGLVCDVSRRCKIPLGGIGCSHKTDCQSDANGTYVLQCDTKDTVSLGACVAPLTTSYCKNNICTFGQGYCSSHEQCAPDLVCSNSICVKPSCQTACSKDGSKVCDPKLDVCVSQIGERCRESKDCLGMDSRCILGICRDANDTLYCRDETCSENQGECASSKIFSPLPHLITIDSLMTRQQGSHLIQGKTSNIQDLGRYEIGETLDVNGDGYDDIAFAFTDSASPNEPLGYGFVLYGAASRSSNTVEVNELGIADGQNHGFSVFYKNSVNAQLRSITLATNIGDIDGDGHDDIGFGGWETNSVWIMYGGKYSSDDTIQLGEFYSSIDPDTITNDKDIGIYAFYLTDNQYSNGYHMSPIGDFNGDGYEDFLVGNTKRSPFELGGPFIVFGRSRVQWKLVAPMQILYYSTLDSSSVLILERPSDTETLYGPRVGSAGDWNNDGFADVMVSSSSDGYFALYFGRVLNAKTPITKTIQPGDGMIIFHDSQVPATNLTFSNYSGIAVGDVNGDGIDDVVIGNGLSGSFSQGAVFLLLGNTFGALWESPIDLRNPQAAYSSYIIPIYGDEFNGEFGADIEVFDVNGDSIDDIVVGAPGIDKVYIILGRLSFTLNTTSADAASDIVIQGTTGSQFGDALGHGDYNGDGIQDLTIGAPQWDGGRGRIYVIPGMINERKNGTFAGCDNGLVCRTIKTSLVDTGITRCLSKRHESYCSNFVKCNIGEGYCKSNSDCNSGLKCDLTNKVCVASVGQSCTDGDDATCEGSTRCINGICRASPFAGYCSKGESLDSRKCSLLEGECTSSLQCSGELRCQLDSNIANHKRCIAKGTSGYCSIVEPCSVGYGKCVNDNQCALGLICDATTSICKSKLGDRTSGCGKQDPNNSTNFLPDDTLCIQQGTKCDATSLVCVINSIGLSGCKLDSECPTGSWCSTYIQDLNGQFVLEPGSLDPSAVSYCVREGTRYMGPGVCSGSETVLILGTGKTTWSQSLSLKQCEDRCHNEPQCYEFASNSVTGACELYKKDACGVNGRSNLVAPNPRMSKYMNITGSNPNGDYQVFRRFCSESNPCLTQQSNGRLLTSETHLRCLDDDVCADENQVCGFPRPANKIGGGYCGLTLGSVCSTDSDCAAPNRCLGGTCKAVVVVDVGRSVIKIGFDPVSNDIPMRSLATEIFIGRVQINTTEFNNQTGRYDNSSIIVDVTAVGDDIARYEGRGAILSGSINAPLRLSYFDPTMDIDWDMVMRIIKASALGSDLNNTALMLTGAIFGYGLPRTCVPGYNYTDIQGNTLATDFADVVDAAMNAFNISHVQFIDAGASAFVGLTSETTGLFIDVSDYQINAVPVINGKVYCASTETAYIGGIKIDNCLRDKLKALSQNNAYFAKYLQNGGDIPRTIVRQLKHRVGQVATSAAEFIQLTTGVNETSAKAIRELILNDDQTLYYRDLDILTCTEEFFTVHQAVGQASTVLANFDKIPDVVSGLLEAIRVTVTGGVTILPGFVERFKNEWLIETGNDLAVFSPNQRAYAAYLGGAIAAQNIPESKWITRESWLAKGSNDIIEEKQINSTSSIPDDQQPGPIVLINGSGIVTLSPTHKPTLVPTTKVPTSKPVIAPTRAPTVNPVSGGSTKSPTLSPTQINCVGLNKDQCIAIPRCNWQKIKKVQSCIDAPACNSITKSKLCAKEDHCIWQTTPVQACVDIPPPPDCSSFDKKGCKQNSTFCKYNKKKKICEQKS